MTILHNTQWIRKQKGLSGTFGVEIETETMERYAMEGQAKMGEYNLPAPHKLDFWKVEEDHSLRNFGFEYILTKPLSFIDTFAALKEFDEKTKAMGINFLQDRHSTSVHVHINFQDETFRTLANFVTLFVLFEEVLVQYCGEDRRSNFFCMTTKYAEGVTKRFSSFFDKVYKGEKNALVNLDPEISKYSSLNIVPLYKQGSVEVRTMRGVTDVAVIYNWVGMLNSLLEFARQNMNPLGILDLWRGAELDLFRDVFGRKYSKLLETQDTLNLINQNLWAVSCIACAVPDWEGLEKEMIRLQGEYDKKKLKGDDDEVPKMKMKVVMLRAPRQDPVQWGNNIVDDEEGQF